MLRHGILTSGESLIHVSFSFLNKCEYDTYIENEGFRKKLCCMELTICQENANICSNFVRSVDRHFVLMSVSFLLILVKKNYLSLLYPLLLRGIHVSCNET